MIPILAKTVELLQEASIYIHRISEKSHFIIVATYWNPVPRDAEGGLFHLPENPLHIDFKDGILTVMYMVGQRGCLIRSSRKTEVIVKAVIDFYKIGERIDEKIYPIGKALFRFQFEGLAAHLENETTISVGEYQEAIEQPTYPEMVEAARSKSYTITDYLYKEDAVWAVTEVNADEKQSFNSVTEAAEYVLDKRKMGKRRRGW